MTDTSPYGTHQHASPDAVRLHTLVGEPAELVTENNVVGTSSATFSTAPYKGGPKIKPRDRTPEQLPVRPRLGRCLGKDDTCKTYPIKGTNWCVFHTKKDPDEPRTTP